MKQWTPTLGTSTQGLFGLSAEKNVPAVFMNSIDRPTSIAQLGNYALLVNENARSNALSRSIVSGPSHVQQKAPLGGFH